VLCFKRLGQPGGRCTPRSRAGRTCPAWWAPCLSRLTWQTHQLLLSEAVVIQVQPAQAGQALQALQRAQAAAASIQLGYACQQLCRTACTVWGSR